ncbi:winged helix-turn-helix domain-containing protein [Nocardia sp. CDC159]|uniref:Winged helix-turn-helix domain-containing protein n=1 Tax=Nocardia pulmonis TaxID=2951408 RepID=A0A9X2EBD7_9NOCA|nr:MULTISPECIES: BTAD domain-containing putative transcriptional regulator [Nocardia]MCM6777125.1 winged helix-turn-helix domain-containing protein [Nocardia pulmonis]MCM6790010.1 winged helix-turn-helix domain-containing protein [Nocardia sp. CDC159]
MATTNISVLGPVQIALDGVEAPLSGRKLRSIVAILAIRPGEWMRRDELIEELQLSGTTDAVNALHAHIARLRKWFGANNLAPDLLETAASNYRLNIDHACVDAHRFSEQVDHALALGTSARSVVAAMLEDSLKLWRGDALADVSDGPVVAAHADQLHQLRAVAREALLDSWIALENYQKVIVNSKTFIAADPFNERLWEMLLIALKSSGRRAEAVEAFRNLRRILDSELGIQPSDRLRAVLV